MRELTPRRFLSQAKEFAVMPTKQINNDPVRNIVGRDCCANEKTEKQGEKNKKKFFHCNGCP